MFIFESEVFIEPTILKIVQPLIKLDFEEKWKREQNSIVK